MTKKELIQKAAAHLGKEGYLVRTSPIMGIDLLMFGDDHNLPIFVAVFDASKVKSIPMNGFGYSQKAKEKAERFVGAARNWLKASAFGRIQTRCDAVYVNGDVISHGINVIHI